MLLLQNPSGALLKTYRSCNQVSSQSKITLQDLFKFKLHSKISSPSHIAHLVILSLLLLLAHSPIVRSRSIPLPASSTQHHNTHSSQDSADNGRVQLTGEPSNANHYIIVLQVSGKICPEANFLQICMMLLLSWCAFCTIP